MTTWTRTETGRTRKISGFTWENVSALGGTRTPNLLIRSQMLYPLSYERSPCSILHSGPSRRVPETCARRHSGDGAFDFLIQSRLKTWRSLACLGLTCRQEVAIRPAGRRRSDQAITFELAEHVLYVLRRPGPRIGDLLNAGGDGPPVDADLVQHEVIGRLGSDIPLPEVGGWEVLQIAGDDDLRTGLDRRGQHVPVSWIGEFEPFDEGFVSGDEAVSDRLVHQLAKAVKLVRRDVRPVLLSARSISSRISLVHLACTRPAWADADQQVSQRVGVEHVGVVDHDEGHWSVQPQFLAQPGELVRGVAALQVIPPPVLTKILEPDPAVGADHAVRNLVRFQ